MCVCVWGGGGGGGGWVGSDEMRAHRMMSEGDSGRMVRRRGREKKYQLDEGCNFYTDRQQFIYEAQCFLLQK